jgi:large subunit ribosomal protein L13
MSAEIVIDGTNALLGRLASFCAKKSLLGHKVVIVNCEKVVIAGNPRSIIIEYQIKRQRGGHSLNGPFFPKHPERIVKRTIRGMLSYKFGRGAAAFEKIRCYNSIPKEYVEVNKIKAGKEKTIKTMTLGELEKEL